MIYLTEKAPADIVDYNLNMSEFVPAGFSIDNTLTVEIEDAGNGESPLALEAFDVSAQPFSEEDTDNICIVFWLRGGTAGVRYQGRIAFNDNQSSDPDRTYERLFQVEVLPL
jgi:hypothetical protein